jgi:hypothetical protein
MKKLLLAIVIFSITSCTKQSADKINDFENLSKNVSNVLEQKSLNAVSNSFRLLNESEKEELWDYKLDKISKNDVKLLTKEQSEIITELRKFLEANGMKKLINEPSIGELFLSKKLDYYSLHFTKKQLYFLIQQPYVHETFSIVELEKQPTVSSNNTGLEFDDGNGTIPNCA